MQISRNCFCKTLTVLPSDRSHNSIRYLPINIDGALAAVFYDLDFPPVLGKAIFITGRVAGVFNLTDELNEKNHQGIS